MSDGTTTWTNTYNSDGLRTSRTNGTTTYNYYYEGIQLTSVSGSNGNIWIFYDASRPVIIKYRDDGDEDTYHYELNLQGDVIAILDPSGNRVVEYTYDAWGNILSITGSMKDTLRIFFCTQKEMTPIPTRRWCQNWCQTKFDMSYFAIKSHKNKEKPRQKPWFLWLRRQDSNLRPPGYELRFT